MSLRPAKLEDAAPLAALSIEVWLGTYLKTGINAFFADYVLTAFTQAKLAARLADPQEHFIVSQNHDGIDGFISIASSRSCPAKGCGDTEISTFYVQPRHHGQGIGKALLNAAMTHCHASQINNLWLATNAENTPAIQFYLAQGFCQIGETHFRLEDQAYLNNVYAIHLG